MQVATLLRCGSVFVADMFGEQKRLMIANVLDAQMLDIEPVGDVQREPADPTSGGAEHLPVERAVLMPELGNSCRHMRWIEPAGSPARYEARTGDNHHHVVCRRCGTIGDVDCAVDETPCLTASQTHGFTLAEAEVTYWGVCPACSSTERGTT